MFLEAQHGSQSQESMGHLGQVAFPVNPGRQVLHRLAHGLPQAIGFTQADRQGREEARGGVIEFLEPDGAGVHGRFLQMPQVSQTWRLQ